MRNGNGGWQATVTAVAAAAAVAIAQPVAAQDSTQIDFKSVGRGAPVAADATQFPLVGSIYDRNTGEFIGGAPPGED